MSVNSMCASSFVVQRQTVTQDTSGGSVRVWVTVAGPSRGDIQPAGGDVQRRFDQQELLCTHTIFFPADPGITPDCRIQTADGKRTFLFRGRLPPAPGYSQWACVVHVEEILLP